MIGFNVTVSIIKIYFWLYSSINITTNSNSIKLLSAIQLNNMEIFWD